jgi:hypothetical protein
MKFGKKAYKEKGKMREDDELREIKRESAGR